MSVLQIPTDNLYKFIAITGLVLVVVSIIGWTNCQNINDQELLKFIANIQTPANVQALFNTKINASDPDSLKRWTEAYNAVKPQYDQWVQDGKNASLELSISQAFTLRWMFIMNVISWVGSAMIPFGFILWFVKVQRYQDIILKNQAKTPTLQKGSTMGNL